MSKLYEHHHRAGRSPFVVDVVTLRRAPATARHIELEGTMDDLEVSGSLVPSDAPVRFRGELESAKGGIYVTGTVTATWKGPCRRCLEMAEGTIEATIGELCAENCDDELTYELGRDELDLEPVLHDACILELPLAPLCRESCLGLCPNCGVNRNLEHCSCEPPRDLRWAALSVFEGEPDNQERAN